MKIQRPKITLDTGVRVIKRALKNVNKNIARIFQRTLLRNTCKNTGNARKSAKILIKRWKLWNLRFCTFLYCLVSFAVGARVISATFIVMVSHCSKMAQWGLKASTGAAATSRAWPPSSSHHFFSCVFQNLYVTFYELFHKCLPTESLGQE